MQTDKQNINKTIIYGTKINFHFLLALDLFRNNLRQYAIVPMYILLFLNEAINVLIFQ